MIEHLEVIGIYYLCMFLFAFLANYGIQWINWRERIEREKKK